MKRKCFIIYNYIKKSAMFSFSWYIHIIIMIVIMMAAGVALR